MTDVQARAHVWTLCLTALVRAALTGPLVALLAPLAHDPAPARHVVAAVLAAALIDGYVALAVPDLARGRGLSRTPDDAGWVAEWDRVYVQPTGRFTQGQVALEARSDRF